MTPDAAQLAHGLNERGVQLARSGQFEAAQQAFEQALRYVPDLPGAHNNLGNIHRRQNRLAEAEVAFLRSHALDPHDTSSLVNLANLYRGQGRYHEALALMRNALAAQPRDAEALRARAKIYSELSQPGEAADDYRQLIELVPHDAELHMELAKCYHELRSWERAANEYRRAIEIDPQFSAAYANLAFILSDQGLVAEAEQAYGKAYRLQPSPRLRIVRDLQLPTIYESSAQIAEVRERLVERLDKLHADEVRIDPTQHVMPNLFYLAYHGCDDRAIMESVGRLAETSRSVQLDLRPRRSGKIRIGFLSKVLRDHTIGRLNRDVIVNLSRNDFEVVFLSTAPTDATVGAAIRSRADQYRQLPGNLPVALQQIASEQLDILFFPDVGMDPFGYTLAYSRLAPVQCLTWGHPDTTGLPTMDYFVSCVDGETDISRKSYSERLELLPRLGVCYERLPVLERVASRKHFDFRDSEHVYCCPQTLFKFHPDFDEVLRGILESDPQAVLVLIESSHRQWRTLLDARWSKTLGAAAKRIRYLPSLARAEYLQLLAAADCILDPLHFGGGNSSYEALAMGTPIVTLPSQFLRGRLTYAMYRQMGLHDLIVDSNERYVQLAVKLGTDSAFHRGMREQILARHGVIYGDRAIVSNIEAFFHRVAGR